MKGVLIILPLLVTSICATDVLNLDKNLNITDDYVEKTVIEHADYTFNLLKAEIRDRITYPNGSIIEESEDLNLQLQMLEFQVWPGDVTSKRFSFDRSDTEVTIRLDRTFKAKMEGRIKITGTVKGEPTDQIGNVTMNWAHVQQRSSLTAAPTSNKNMHNYVEFTSPTTTIEGISFQGIPAQKTQQLLKSILDLYQDRIILSQNGMNGLTE